MAKKKKSRKGKGHYAAYKAGNNAYKNKIAKLKRLIKEQPNNKVLKEALKKVEKEGYNGRSKPLVPGSNKTKISPIKAIRNFRATQRVKPEEPKTPAEQLSKLLGIPLPKERKPGKPKIFVKKKRNVTNSKRIS